MGNDKVNTGKKRGREVLETNNDKATEPEAPVAKQQKTNLKAKLNEAITISSASPSPGMPSLSSDSDEEVFITEQEISADYLLLHIDKIKREKAEYDAIKQAEIEALEAKLEEISSKQSEEEQNINDSTVDDFVKGQDAVAENESEPKKESDLLKNDSPTEQGKEESDKQELNEAESVALNDDVEDSEESEQDTDSPAPRLYDDSRDLNFFGMTLTEDNITEELKAAFAAKRDVNRLNLNRRKLDERSLKKVIEFLEDHPLITNLSLGDTGLKATEIKLLADFLKTSQISKLDLSDNLFDLETIEYLMSSLSDDNCKLTSLSLSINRLSKNSISTIIDYLPKTRIDNLDLGANKISDEIIDRFLGNVQNLKTLTLSCNHIDDEAIPSLISLLQSSNIELLDLDYNRLSEEGCKLFEEIGLAGRVSLEENSEDF